MNQSLSQFFNRQDPARLNNCESEPVHLSGMIQNVGGMLVLDAETQCIIGASDNLQDILGFPSNIALGARLADIDAEVAKELSLLALKAGVVQEVLDTAVKVGSVAFDITTHIHKGYQFVEFIPNNDPSATHTRKRMRLCSKACAQMMNAVDFASAQQIATQAVRDITGFDRVKIYRFLPDWSGTVEAESRAAHMPSYLGLHFPEGDIPMQVREMMKIVPCRVIGTVSDDNIPIRTLERGGAPLDQTWATMRSVSTMHTAYLRNMGLSSTFSCALKNEGRLWGMIACHNQDESVVPVDSWSLIQEIGSALMMRMQQDQRAATADMITDLRRVENNFASELRREGDVEQVIMSMVPILQKFLRADGFAFQYGNNIHTSGETPPTEFIRTIVKWAQNGMTDNDQFQTTALHLDFPAAEEHLETACGALIQPIVMHRVCQLIWFRGPVTRRVEWAGHPNSKTVKDPKSGVIVGPRTSFDRWVEEHRDQSLAWEPQELEAAREIFKEFLDIIASQVLLKKENDSLRQFAHAAAHDIRAPLRGIKLALDWMEEDGFDEASVRQCQEIASLSATKLQQLTEALIELTLLTEEAPDFTCIDLHETMKDVVGLIAGELKETGGRIVLTDLPKVTGSETMLTRLFLNVVGNALKYRRKDVTLEVEVNRIGHTPIIIAVTDNGTGIDAKYAEKIFEPTQRLVQHSEVEGTGLGLAISKRIIELHGGKIRLDTAYKDGARFLLEFPVVH